MDVPSDLWTGFKVTDLVIAISAACAACFAFLQWRVYTRQAKLLEETREIADAGLGRPHIFFELISHNFNEWREGRADYPIFFYQFTNYGTSPAIIHYIAARAFLSRGPRFGEDKETNIIQRFPTPDKLVPFLAWNPTVRVAKRTPIGWEAGQDWAKSRIFIVSPQRSSSPLATNAMRKSLAREEVLGVVRARGRLEHYLYEESGPEGWVAPWLIGRIMYSDTLRRRYHTGFCIRAERDGEYTEDGDPPYNERT